MAHERLQENEGVCEADSCSSRGGSEAFRSRGTTRERRRLCARRSSKHARSKGWDPSQHDGNTLTQKTIKPPATPKPRPKPEHNRAKAGDSDLGRTVPSNTIMDPTRTPNQPSGQDPADVCTVRPTPTTKNPPTRRPSTPPTRKSVMLKAMRFALGEPFGLSLVSIGCNNSGAGNSPAGRRCRNPDGTIAGLVSIQRGSGPASGHDRSHKNQPSFCKTHCQPWSPQRPHVRAVTSEMPSAVTTTSPPESKICQPIQAPATAPNTRPQPK